MSNWCLRETRTKFNYLQSKPRPIFLIITISLFVLPSRINQSFKRIYYVCISYVRIDFLFWYCKLKIVDQSFGGEIYRIIFFFFFFARSQKGGQRISNTVHRDLDSQFYSSENWSIDDRYWRLNYHRIEFHRTFQFPPVDDANDARETFHYQNRIETLKSAIQG